MHHILLDAVHPSPFRRYYHSHRLRTRGNSQDISLPTECVSKCATGNGIGQLHPFVYRQSYSVHAADRSFRRVGVQKYQGTHSPLLNPLPSVPLPMEKTWNCGNSRRTTLIGASAFIRMYPALPFQRRPTHIARGCQNPGRSTPR